jgi:hypothetical protein
LLNLSAVASQWYSVGAPKGTPANVIAVPSRTINAGCYASLKAQIADLGGTLVVSTLDEFGALIAAETENGRRR